MTFWRALSMPEFWLLFVTAADGAWGAGAWWIFVPLCAMGLLISAWPKAFILWPQRVKFGVAPGFVLSLLHSTAAASSAFLLGSAIGWFWW